MALPVGTDYTIPVVKPQLWGRAVDLYDEPGVPGLDGVTRWPAVGLQLVPMGCPTTTAGPAADPCAVSFNFAAPDSFQSAVTFKPFRIEESVSCSTIGVWSPEELQQWAESEARATYSVQLARQALYGTFGANTSLSAEADDVTVASDLTPVGALAAVEIALGQRLMGSGMVHVNAGMLTRLKSAGALQFLNGQWYTASGNVVVADYGYYAVQGGTDYIYGSGQVHYATTDWTTSIGASVGNGGHNDYYVYVQAWSMVWFEPCPVVKAATNVATTTVNFGL